MWWRDCWILIQTFQPNPGFLASVKLDFKLQFCFVELLPDQGPLSPQWARYQCKEMASFQKRWCKNTLWNCHLWNNTVWYQGNLEPGIFHFHPWLQFVLLFCLGQLQWKSTPWQRMKAGKNWHPKDGTCWIKCLAAVFSIYVWWNINALTTMSFWSMNMNKFWSWPIETHFPTHKELVIIKQSRRCVQSFHLHLWCYFRFLELLLLVHIFFHVGKWGLVTICSLTVKLPSNQVPTYVPLGQRLDWYSKFRKFLTGDDWLRGWLIVCTK